MAVPLRAVGNRATSLAWTWVGMAIVCLGLLLQQLLVPLHLARHEHVWAIPATGHVHSHDWVLHPGHDHSHGAPGAASAADGEHRPHPAREHLDEQPSASVAPSIAVLLVAPPARLELEGLTCPAASLRRPDALARWPRPPPPRAVAPARAPPSVA